MSFLKKSLPAALAAILATALAAPSSFADTAAQKPKVEKAPAAAQQQKSANDAVARVDGTVITKGELDRAVKVLLAQNQIEQQLPPEVMKQAEGAALDQLISAELLYQEGSKLKIKDLDKQVDEKIAANRAKFATQEELEKALKEVDMTVKDMRDFTRKDLVIAKLIETEYAAKLAAPSDEEARKVYQENLDKYFRRPETVRASHILVGVEENATEAERKKAKEKAEALLKRVKAGEDFAALAKSDSTCPSKEEGGDLGAFPRGKMVPAFEEAAFALKVGEVSGVVETQFGYHIIKLTDRQEASTDKFEDVKPKIVQFLKQEKLQKIVAEHVEALRSKAKIEKL